MIDVILNKIKFYAKWYLSMNAEERNSDVGMWVIERILIYGETLQSFSKPVKENLEYMLN